ILDLCTGGGSIAIAAALHFDEAAIDATDLSAEALALAAENRALYQLDSRLSLFRGDLYDALGDRQYDLILSNPPYVNAGSMAALPAEFLHEPQGALDGGVDGMSLVERILRDAPAHLSKDGVLFVEIGHEADHFEAAFPTLEFAYVPVSAGDRLIVALTRAALQAWAAR
ncbi:MAG TPA: HemK family protein methyltransferase, partial [Burkholderiaceae bacterium]|nr:HemK family protein methyltransferase [Burkholderiaceae bacterium]